MKAEKDKKTGKWLIQYRYTDWQGKRRKSTKRGFATKREAEEWLRNFLIKQKADFDMKFEDFWKMYYADIETRLREHTMRTKKYIVELKILPYFGNKRVNDITAADIRQWQNELIKMGYSPTYLKTINNQLSAIFNYAVRYYDLKSNPCAKAGSMGKSKAEEMDFWIGEEFRKFIDSVMNKRLSYMAFMTLYWTGMRLGELLALNPKDVDLEKRTISITKSYQRLGKKDVITPPKTPKSKRVITIPEFLAADIKDYMDSLKSLGFQGGAKHDTELNQWINHEKEVLAEIMERHEIEWEQRGTHEEHLDVYNFKKKERAKEVKELEQKIENLTADVEATESDIKALNQEKADAEKARDQVRESKEQADKELKHMEKQRNQLQPIINSIDKELKNSGQIKLVLPEVGALELASTYRNKKIKPLFAKMKNYIAGLAAKVIELSREAEKWRDKYQQLKKDYDDLEKDADKVADMCNQLCDDVDKLEVISDKYKRALRIFGSDTIESAIWRDIQKEKALEEQKRKEQMPRKLSDRLQWGRERSQEHNMQQKKNKIKHKEMEL